MALRAGDVVGSYQVVELLGRGAFGDVTLARDLRCPGQFLALKTVCEETGPEAHAAKARHAALSEAELLRRLQHPHIVRLEDICWDADRRVVCLALEFMDGGSLQNLISSQRDTVGCAFEVSFTRRVLTSLGSALQYIHSAGVLHRDVKPANVLLTKQLQHIKLADFGIAKLMEMTGQAHTVIGTPYYFSPELVSGDAYGAASDIWALGVVLYELAALRRPFEASNPLALARRICEDAVPALPTDTAADLARVIPRLLEKEPHNRMSLTQAVAELFIEAPPGSAALCARRMQPCPTMSSITAVGDSVPLEEEVLPDACVPRCNRAEQSPQCAFAAAPEEKKPKDKKREKSDVRRWFRFRKGPRNLSRTRSTEEEVTLVCAFSNEAEDPESAAARESPQGRSVSRHNTRTPSQQLGGCEDPQQPLNSPRRHVPQPQEGPFSCGRAAGWASAEETVAPWELPGRAPSNSGAAWF